MTLILKLDLDMVKMYLHTKKEVSMSRGSKVIAFTDRNTDRHTDRHTERQTHRHAKNITYLHTWVAMMSHNQLTLEHKGPMQLNKFSRILMQCSVSVCIMTRIYPLIQ